MVHFEVFVHQRFEIVRADAAEDDHLDRIGEEADRAMIGEEARILRHDRAADRVVAVRLERHHAGLLRQLEHLIQHGQQIEIVILRLSRPEQAGELPEHLLDHHHRRADQQRADGGPADDQELRGLVEHQQLAAVHQVSTCHGCHHYEDADNQQHLSNSNALRVSKRQRLVSLRRRAHLHPRS